MNIFKITILLSFITNLALAQGYEPVFTDLSGEELLDSLVENYKPDSILDYANARDTMYAKIYNIDGNVSCVYTGHTLSVPEGVDPSAYLFQSGSNDGINCEHTYPRSMGASEENGNAYSDMHHLFPTRTKANSERSNFPYGELDDEITTSWLYLNQSLGTIPTVDIDLYSERVFGMFEPREDHKGNVARAVFYFYTMYKDEALEANANFFESQRETLCGWHALDSVDMNEWNRTFEIAEYQDGLPNPFILDCSLVYRSYCEDFSSSSCIIPETPVDTSTTSLNENLDLGIKIYPNPVSDILQIETIGSSDYQVTDYVGRVIMTGKFDNFTTLDFRDFSNGVYFVKINTRIYKIVKQE